MEFVGSWRRRLGLGEEAKGVSCWAWGVEAESAGGWAWMSRFKVLAVGLRLRKLKALTFAPRGSRF